MKSIILTLIVIEYNCIEDIRKSVDNLHSVCEDISHEIIISSNSLYPLDVQTKLKDEFLGCIWFFNKNNLGFAGGMNIGIANAKGEIIIIVNPDVKIFPENFKKALEFLRVHPKVGLLGPKIIDSAGNQQDTCRKFMRPVDLLYRLSKRLCLKKDVLLENGFDYNNTQTVDWVIGAFMMVRRDGLDVVGGLDDGYFLYVEDMDWCKRFWDKGYEVVYYPELVVEYKGDRKSVSPLVSGQFSYRYGYFHLKSYFRFLKKHGINPTRYGLR